MSPVSTRARSATGAGVIAIVVRVLAFGNQAYAEWADRHAQAATSWDLLLRTLAWPRWFITTGGTATKDVIAFDIRAILLRLSAGGPTTTRGSGVPAESRAQRVTSWVSTPRAP